MLQGSAPDGSKGFVNVVWARQGRLSVKKDKTIRIFIMGHLLIFAHYFLVCGDDGACCAESDFTGTPKYGVPSFFQ